MLADYHLHTNFSDDSTTPMEDMVKKAIENGLDEIAFTEHCDYFRVGGNALDYDAYFASVDEMREKYGDQITIRYGAEFGVQEHTVERYQADFKKRDFDFIILSVHEIGDEGFWNNQYQKGKTQDEINRGYYQALYGVMQKYKNYSVLGHVDVIKRYDPYGIYPDEKVKDLLEKILKLAIADGKGIEINTSCFAYGLPDLTPSKYILKLYHDLGGKILTIGTDAHAPDRMGNKEELDMIKKILREIGFESFCTFEKMQPHFHKL